MQRRDFLRLAASTCVAATVSNRSLFAREYGLVFEDGRDSASEINAALQFARRNGRKQLILPAGTPLLSQSIKIPSNMAMIGQPEKTTLRAAPQLNSHVITNLDSEIMPSDIGIYDLIIDGSKLFQGPRAKSRGIYLQSTENLIIKNVKVKNTVEHCIHISNSRSDRIILNQKVINCTLSNAGNGNGNSSSGLASSSADDLHISNVRSTSHERAGFRLGVRRTATLENTLAVYCGDGGYVPVSGSTGIKFVNSVALRNGWRNRYEGFRLVGITNCSLERCQSRENMGSGLIMLNGCENIKIERSIFTSNGHRNREISNDVEKSAGILIRSSGRKNSKITISRSLCVDQGARVQNYGIFIDDRGISDLRIIDTDLSDNVDKDIFVKISPK